MPGSFIVSTSPHLRTPLTAKVMDRVCCAAADGRGLLFIFGVHSLAVILTSIVTCVLAELACNRVFGQETTITDASAAVTGILFAFTLPPTTPLWMVAVGGVLAIVVVKQLFGGLGYNVFNPALAARAILLASWPVAITTWATPVNSFLATDVGDHGHPVGLLKEAQRVAGSPDPWPPDSSWAMCPGCWETCKVTLLGGGGAARSEDHRLAHSDEFHCRVVLFAGRDPLAAVLPAA